MILGGGGGGVEFPPCALSKQWYLEMLELGPYAVHKVISPQKLPLKSILLTLQRFSSDGSSWAYKTSRKKYGDSSSEESICKQQ